MDNFDLKKYLTEGRIYEEDKEVKTWWIHKFTNKQTGDTYYSPSSLSSDPNLNIWWVQLNLIKNKVRI